MRLRKNVKSLSPTQKTKFVNAVLALKTKPSVLHPGDGNLSRYDDYAEVHMNAMMANPGWAHRRPAFFPWHRIMLLAFEDDLVNVDSTVTIPYWDWTDNASNPFTSGFLGGNGDAADDDKVKTGPFAHDGPNAWTIKIKDSNFDPDFLQRSFGTDPTAMNLPTASDVDTALLPASYDSSPWANSSAGMRSSAENNLHNLVHRWVGGTMGAMTSPNDPVFFLHHCNLDRLWARWQRIHPGSSPYLPVSGAAQGHNLNDAMIFSDGPPAPWPGTWTPASVIDHHALGYQYDDEFVSPAVHLPLSYVRILFGVINDAPGWVIGPDGKPHPVGPGDPWRELSVAGRNELAGLAIHQVAALLSNKSASREIQNIAGKLIGKQGQQIVASMNAKSKKQR
ncbi:MAG TPA: tyrosinase family protein [Pyrinomonadaceae bacterium]|jgi:tyrosinase|nr:tyrosinase family protein [Pyrinomonadaceae bacterium]